MFVTSRRRFLGFTASTLVAGVLDHDLLLAQDKNLPLPAAAVVTTRSGHTWNVSHPALINYFGKTEYWYSTQTSYRSYDSKPGNILLIQGWVWSEVPLARIASITRSSVNSENGDLIRKKQVTASGLPFEIEDYTTDIFDVTFKDGTKTLTELPDRIHGKARIKSLVGTYSAKPSDIESITMTEGAEATFRLKSGAVQQNVFEIASSKDGAYDTLTSHITEEAELVVDCPNPQGGVMVTLTPAALAGRKIVLTRVVPDPNIRRKPEDRFTVAGLTESPIDGEIGWIRSDTEAFPCELDALEGVCQIGGDSCRVFIDPKDIVSISISSAAGRTVVDAITLSVGGQSFDLPGLRNVTFWYPQWASGYNASSEEHSFTYTTAQITTEIELSDVRSLSVDSSGQTTLTLKNGESYVGSLQVEDGKPLGIIGKIEGGYGGFAAKGCFILGDIASVVFSA